jgi:hypothetical protein
MQIGTNLTHKEVDDLMMVGFLLVGSRKDSTFMNNMQWLQFWELPHGKHFS